MTPKPQRAPQQDHANLDAVFSTLRATAPREGFERRLLARLATRESAPRESATGATFFAAKWLLPFTATCALAIALASAPVLRRHPEHSEGPPHSLSSAQPTGLPSRTEPGAVQRPAYAYATKPGGPSFAASSPTGVPVERVLFNGVERAGSEAAPTLAQLALTETQSPSLSSPTLPLTQQERLLLRANTRGELIQLTELEPARERSLRDALEASRRLDVNRYIAQQLAPIVAAEHLDPTPQSDDVSSTSTASLTQQ